ncbi:hypothetical protein VIGAN_11195400, partial [Vigna angularis var. angularis]
SMHRFCNSLSIFGTPPNPHVLIKFPTPQTSTFTPCNPRSISGACPPRVPDTCPFSSGAPAASSNPHTNHSSRSLRRITFSHFKSLCMNDRSCNATIAFVTNFNASTNSSQFPGFTRHPLGLNDNPSSLSEKPTKTSACGILWSRIS